MARKNTSTKKPSVKTHENAPAKRISKEWALRRSVMSCLLWENTFYEDGVEIAERIASLVPLVKPEKVAAMAIEAREEMKLRHMPLYLTRLLAKEKYTGTSTLLERVIQRADELSEFLAMYWGDKKTPIASQVKRGLAQAFTKFDEYSLSKYDQDNAIKLRDVMFMVHPKPKDKKQAALWKRLVNGTMKTPDTWEVALSAGNDKKESWERLLKEKKLGGLALLRNLRNMEEVKVDQELVRQSILEMNTERILPFRFIAASRHGVRYEPELEKTMFRCLNDHDKLDGKTVLLVDVSGSMNDHLSAKSDLTRLDAANGLAMLLREICKDVQVYSFSDDTIHIPSRRGFALRDAIERSQHHNGTYLGKAIDHINDQETYKRLIVITDEQSHDSVPAPKKGLGYIINVASNTNGVGYGPWLHIDGWSEAIIKYIIEYEKLSNTK